MNVEHLRRIFDRGLCVGKGSLNGQMCAMSAVGVVTHGYLTDSPAYVNPWDAGFIYVINDANWSSPQARANALWPLTLKAIGTYGKSRNKWARILMAGIKKRVAVIGYGIAARQNKSLQRKYYSLIRDCKNGRTNVLKLTSMAENKQAISLARHVSSGLLDSVTGHAHVVSMIAKFGPELDETVNPDAILQLGINCALEAYENDV